MSSEHSSEMTEKSGRPWMDWWQSANQIALVFGVGLTYGIVGPSLIDLAVIHSTTPDREAMMDASRALGMFLGSCAGGFLFKRMNDQILMMIALTIYGTVTVLIPIIPNIMYLTVLAFSAGVAVGLAYLGAQMRLVRIWTEHSASAIQAFNTAFGVGSMIAPVVCAPFLSLREHGHLVKETRLYIPFTAFGLLFLLVLISMAAAYYVDPSGIGGTEDGDAKSNGIPKDTLEITLVVLLFFYITICMSAEVSFSNLISIYAVRNPDLRFSKTDAAYLAGVFWGTFTGGRVISVFALMVVNIKQLLVVSHFLCMCSSVILVGFASCAWCTWLGSALMGLGLSSMYGAASGLVFEYFHAQHFHISIILTAACLGMAVAGYFVPPMVEMDPMFLQYFTGLENVAHLIILIVIFLTTHGKPKVNVKQEKPVK